MAQNETIGRVPIEVVQIDQDYCSNTYGTGACTAVLADGGRKCFNTIGTCQDVANYAASTLTLNFCSNQSQIPYNGTYYFPFLQSVNVRSGSINPGGGNKSASALGERSTISVSLTDAPHTDRIVDPYVDERRSGAAQSDGVGYEPYDRGTFFSKWKARNKYYLNRPIRYISGYLVDGEIVDSVTRTFFITAMSGPTASGSVSFQGKDVLTLMNNDKAKAPSLSAGKLDSALSLTSSSLTLTPAGIGDLEYPVSGKVRVNDEIMEFTRATGSDVLTLTRGWNNTTEEHEAGDTVQLCLEYSSERPDDILYDLLTNYAGIDASYLDSANWETEVDSFMPRVYNTVIAEPTGVKQLVSEMCEQMYFYIWFDEREDLVKLRAVRPAEDETVYQLTDSRHLVEDSLNVMDATDQLITQVWVHYGLRDPAKDMNEVANYAATDIISDLEEEGTVRNRGARIKQIFSRWINSAGGDAAQEIGEKILARYSTVPKKVSFTLDAKDRDVWVGSFATLNFRTIVDDVGNQQPINIQVMNANESKTGTTYSYTGQEFVFETPPDADTRAIIISGDQSSINLRTVHDQQYTPPVGTETITFTVRNGVRIGSEHDATYQAYTGNVNVGTPSSRINVSTTLQPVYSDEVAVATFYDIGDTPPNMYVAENPVNWETVKKDLSSYTMETQMWMLPRPVAIETGSWPVGVTLNLIIEPGAYIVGAGGFGTCHNAWFSTSNRVLITSSGGDALKIDYPITINNGGVIAGGGAGGAGIVYGVGTANDYVIAHGGGGGGYEGGPTVSTVLQDVVTSPVDIKLGPVTDPSAGSSIWLGADFDGGTGATFNGGTCKDGFGLGLQPAAAPYGMTIGASTFWAGNVLAGRAVVSGSSNITWTNKGDVRGDEL